MAQTDFIPEQMPDLDSYDREERGRKAIRTLLKAIIVRLAAGILLVFAVARAGASPVALGLTAFALLVIFAGMLPLLGELKKQVSAQKDLLEQQKQNNC